MDGVIRKKILPYIKENKLILLFFITLFLIGLFTFKDYGVSIDEPYQRNHTGFNYYEYLKLFSSEKGAILVSDYYEMISFFNYSIKDYPYKYYGVGIQLPTIIIEHIYGFRLDFHTVYNIRHFYTFLIYFIAMIYFYLILNKYILKNKNYSLIGTIFLVISPKIYGDAFYNIKDLMFMSLCIINCYYCMKFLEKGSLKNIIKLSIITAFTINSRIVGGIIIFLCFMFSLILNRKNLKTTIYNLLKVFIFTYLFYFIITPPMWYDPIKFPFKVMGFFNNYYDPISKYGHVSFYFGDYIDAAKLPWHYLPLFIILSTPILYTVLFVIAIICGIKGLLRKNISNYNLLFLNIILFVILLSCIILKPTLYGGWRHAYFLYPMIIVNSILGLKWLFENCKKIRLLIKILITINIFVLISWMIKNHPYQSNYFSMPYRKYALENFDNNYWKLANGEALKYIANIDDRDVINVKSEYDFAHVYELDDKDRKRLIIDSDIITNKNKYKYFDYIIDTRIHGNKYLKDYYEIKTKKMDGIRLYTIYKHK